MRIIADVHIRPVTVQHLNSLGHEAIRSIEVLPEEAPDQEIIGYAGATDRVILTEDLDFSDIIAISGATQPSLITLRLTDASADHVNRILAYVLPGLEELVSAGILATVEDERVRVRELPVR
jgi:predicted nuclease of predicted toxin-antitoxin system